MTSKITQTLEFIKVVKNIRKDINEGIDTDSIEKYDSIRSQNPLIYKLAVEDPDCEKKLCEMYKLMLEKNKGLSQYDASAKFGKIMADEYFPKNLD